MIQRKTPRTDPALLAAIKKAGGVKALSDKLHVTVGAVSQWDRIPLKHVDAVADLIGWSRERIRFDIFAPRSKKPAQQAVAS